MNDWITKLKTYWQKKEETPDPNEIIVKSFDPNDPAVIENNERIKRIKERLKERYSYYSKPFAKKKLK
jgi:hypothetical protein